MDWLRAAVPIVLQHDLITAHRVFGFVAGGDSSAYQQAAAQVVEATVERYSGRLIVHTVVRNLRSQTVRPVADVSGPEGSGILPLLDQTAKRLDPNAAPFPTSRADVLSRYAKAVTSGSAQQRIAELQQIVAEDPTFGPAQLALIATAAENRLPQTAALVQAAAPHRAAFDVIDRLSYDTTAARLLRAPIATQTQAAAALVKLAPNDLEALSVLGTADFLQNDASGGERLLKRALALTDGNASIRLQLGIGYIETRQYAKAIELLQNDKDFAPATAYSVAQLLEGHKDKAAEVMDQLYRARVSSHDPFANLSHAEWIAISNGYRGAIAELQGTTWAEPDDKAIALAQAAIWELASGSQPVASATAQRAASMATGKAQQFTAVAMAMCSADAASALEKQIGNSAALPSRVLLGFAQFLRGDYGNAAKQWEAILQDAGGADNRSRAMLAASLAKLHQRSPSIVQPYVPDLSGADPFAAIAFQQMRQQIGQ